MKKDILLRFIAEIEINEAYHWYEKRREGLGNDILLCIEKKLEQISRKPELYPLVHKNVRRALINRFPYGIFYINEAKRIVVIAFFHASRRPKSWKQRT
jgi:plasmid stabilization system protein ParE